MKMNFKYVMMAAILSMGFAGCSNNDDDAVDNLPVEGAKSFATITLKSDAVTRAEATFGATDAEKKIYSVKVYVFNSLKVLELIETFTAADLLAGKKTFETTAGTHYFMAVVNAPVITVPLGTSMDYLSQLINNIDATKFAGYIDPAVTVNKGFFMTTGVYTDDSNGARYYRSHDYAQAVLAVWDGTDIAPSTNQVAIPIGRAMAKVNLAILKAQTGTNSIAGDEGTIDVPTAKYTVANNPDQMYYFPYFGTAQQFQTPTFDFYNKSVAPSTYWPALHNLVETDIVKEIATSNTFSATEEHMKPLYALENSNQLPTYGNATIISVKATFLPDAAAWEDAAPASSVKTFYRIYNKENEVFYTDAKKGFWSGLGVATDKVTALGDDYELITYTDGVCYYIIPLKNKKRTAAPEWYDVVRNHFYDVVITKITGCGYNKPGGNDKTEPTDPLDPDTYNVEVSIEVKSWIHVIQEEEVGIRP